MFVTHHFARPEALARARDWLASLGFDPDCMMIRLDGLPRITLNCVDSARAAAAAMLFNALDSIEPEGPVGVFDPRRLGEVARAPQSPGDPPAVPAAAPAFSRSLIHVEFARDPLPAEVDWAERRPRRLM